MSESKRRANIKQTQARQRRYHAQGRCWCGQTVRHGYKRCDNCIVGYNQRRVKYQEQGRCYCGNRVIPGVKRNGAPYKSCQQCRDRAKARYQRRKSRL